jgi:hypothetical protein
MMKTTAHRAVLASNEYSQTKADVMRMSNPMAK